MVALGVTCAVRHQAAADALATAELLLKLWPALRAEFPRPSFRSALGLAEQRRWLAPEHAQTRRRANSPASLLASSPASGRSGRWPPEWYDHGLSLLHPSC